MNTFPNIKITQDMLAKVHVPKLPVYLLESLQKMQLHSDANIFKLTFSFWLGQRKQTFSGTTVQKYGLASGYFLVAILLNTFHIMFY